MISNNRIKQLKSLHQKKYRRIENKFLLEGHRLIDQAISSNAKIDEIWITKQSKESIVRQELLNKIEANNISCNFCSEKIIRQISDTLNVQGVIALCQIPKYQKYQKPPKQSLYLDGISDPGNMGTILRTAAWFGIKSIFLSPKCVDVFNSKVVRSGMGAHFFFNHLEIVLNEVFFSNLNKYNIEILGSDTEGISIHKLNISDIKKWCLILGNESHGISDFSKEFITNTISIPGVIGMESLNVSIAGGIIINALISNKIVTN